MIIITAVRFIEGALMRRHDGGAGCGACGRGRTYPRFREASGPRSGALRPPARSSLGGEGPKVFGPPKRRSPKRERRDGPPDRSTTLENADPRTEIASKWPGPLVWVERREAPHAGDGVRTC